MKIVAVLKKRVGRRPRPKLTIAIDCGSLSPSDARAKGGVATITFNLIESLAKIDKRNSYVFFSFSPLPPKLLNLFGNRVTQRILPQKGFMQLWMPISLKLLNPDVFLALSQVHPKVATPTLGFVYDLAFLHFPILYKDSHRLAKNTQYLVDKSRHIVTISEASKSDILKKYKLREKNVTVAYPGVSDLFCQNGPKFVDEKKYILYIGALKRTKQIPVMLTGFSKFWQKNKNFRFVIVGSDRDLDPEINKTIKALKLEEAVVFKGYTQIYDLPKYLRGAFAFVSTAVYEGFGLPLVEAMACGTPTVTGNNSAMREVVGKAGILVDASSGDEIAKSLNKLVDDPKYRDKLIKLGLAQVKLFKWHKFAKEVLDCVYKYCV